MFCKIHWIHLSRLENEYVSVDTTWYYRIQLERYEAVEYNTLNISMKYRMILYCIQYQYAILIAIYTVIKEGYNCIYHISLCKYYTGPLDPGIFGHDRSKKPSLLNNLLFLQAGPPNFWSFCWSYYKFEYIYTKDWYSKKTPNTVVMHYFLFYCISLYTHYTYIKVQCIKNMYNKNCSEMNTVAYRKIY